MEALLEQISDYKELSSYYNSFESMQNFLLDEKRSYLELDVIQSVLSFMKEGTKKRKKKNFKVFFADKDIDMAKEIIKVLVVLDVAMKNKEVATIKVIKNDLITQGMLGFNKTYLDSFHKPGHEVREEIDVRPQIDTRGGGLEIYWNWVENVIGDLNNNLYHAFQNKSLNTELVSQFVREFKQYLNGRLLLKIVSVDARQIVGVPIHLYRDRYYILPHPFLESDWELSRPIDTVKNRERIKVGDVVAANFTDNKNERYIHTLLYVDFDGAEIIPQTLRQALSEFVDDEYIEQAYKVFEINDAKDEEIKAIFTKKLIDTSGKVGKILKEDLNQLNEIRKQIANEEEKLSREEDSLDENRKSWFKVLKRINELIDIDEGYQLEKEEYEKVNFNRETFISDLQSLFYHNDGHHLIYKPEIIKSFVYSIQANILTLLAGPSGTGKSSIVQAFGRSVENVEVRMIPVQSSWTDTQDLLGYFHPTDKAFVPTPFMEAMAEAALEKNKNKVYLICLDEMNLAHIEYYFSEILSAREEKLPTIRLYPKRYWDIAKLNLNNQNVSVEQQKSAEELINLYPHIFRIPNNVRFIGTLNIDHTVKPISPKVIDRSFIIEIGHLNSHEKEEIKTILKSITGKVEMKYDTFKSPVLDELNVNEGIKLVQDISELLDDYPNAALNSRGYKHIRHFLTFTNSKEELNELLDYIICGKILPRLEIKKSDLVKHSDTLLRVLAPYKLSYKRFTDMLNTKHIVKFW
jgi:energy-coupling factor transporter ATP-binding protein EcfA2